MVQAYVLIQTEVGKAALVAEAVRDIQGVDAADDVGGADHRGVAEHEAEHAVELAERRGGHAAVLIGEEAQLDHAAASTAEGVVSQWELSMRGGPAGDVVGAGPAQLSGGR